MAMKYLQITAGLYIGIQRKDLFYCPLHKVDLSVRFDFF